MRALTFIVIVSHCGIATADGLPTYYDSAARRWNLASERAQHAVVAIDRGIETMLLQVQLDRNTTPENASRLVWITPVPAPAAEVQVDILRGFPRFGGREPPGELADTFRMSFGLMSLTQIYPMPLLLTTFVMKGGRDAATVHQRIERDGVTVELVSAESAETLDAYLRAQEVELPPAGLESLASYADPSACFVVYRITDLNTYRQRTSEAVPLGISVQFPSEDGFFPLVASSSLPSGYLYVSVVVPAFVEAITHPPEMTTKHFVGWVYGGTESLAALRLSNDDQDLRYTRFTFEAPAAQLTEDLRFRPGAPPRTRFAAEWMASSHFVWSMWVLSLVLFIMVNSGAALIARLAWPADKRMSMRTAVLFGLSNFFTIIGVLIVATIMGKKAQLGGFRLTALFSLTFCVLLIVLTLVVSAIFH